MTPSADVLFDLEEMLAPAAPVAFAPARELVVLDHFAGHGWGVACRWLGLLEYGVEIMPDAIRTRTAAGMRTIYRDVWAGLLHPWLVPAHDVYLASPPCQTFSIAGKGAGRRDLDLVLELMADGVWRYPQQMRALAGGLADDRTALVLTPLAHIYQHRPTYVALEQVPTVLPVWEAIAVEMRKLGYSVWTGNLQAEAYGVPQTRKRALLIARLDGVAAAAPRPTHSRYYSANPTKLDPGMPRWRSMADALGWGMTARPYPTIATGTESGGTDPAALGGSGARRMVYAERAAGRWTPSGDADNDGGILRLTAQDAAVLQSYPRRWGFTDRPAVTVGNAVGRGLIGGSGAKEAVVRAIADGTFIPSQGDGSNYAEATRITVEEAGVLQSYQRGFPFRGKKGRQFLQIGNAVPPLLAAAVLAELTS